MIRKIKSWFSFDASKISEDEELIYDSLNGILDSDSRIFFSVRNGIEMIYFESLILSYKKCESFFSSGPSKYDGYFSIRNSLPSRSKMSTIKHDLEEVSDNDDTNTEVIFKSDLKRSDYKIEEFISKSFAEIRNISNT